VTFVLAWIAFPVVMSALALGCGLAAERAAGVRLPAVLLAPAGFAVIVAVAQLATASSATARLATPLVVAIAAAGLAASPPWQDRGRFDGWATAAAIGVFVVFGAPVILSGHPTIAGWIKLDDSATWLAFTDRIMEHGRSLTGLAPSSYEATLGVNLPGGYPIGAFLPLGVGSQILNQDPAWLFQPCLSFMAAMLSLSLNGLLLRVVPERRARATCAFVAAQPALLFGYAQWGGIKELATAATVAAVVALAPVAAERGATLRAAVPLAAAGAATLAIVSFGGVVWLVLPVVAMLAAAGWRRGRRAALELAGGLGAAGLLLATPSLVLAHSFLAPLRWVSMRGATSETVIGNLFGPLKPLQIVGVWPSGDFRVHPHSIAATDVLIAIAAIAVAVGLVAVVARRAWELGVYAVGVPALALAIFAFTTPWVGGKTLAIASPALLLGASAGVAHLWSRGWRIPSGVLGACIAGGVLWSNALAYSDVTLAPYHQLRELEQIGHRFAGQGPALMTEYNPFGARHFLRLVDGEGVSELRRRLIPLRNGQLVPPGAAADTDDLRFDDLLVYRTLVIRRSPLTSRPPGMYRLVWQGRDYEVWQRPAHVAQSVNHLPLGGPMSPVARPSCADVARLAAAAGPRGVVSAVPRPAPIFVGLGSLQRPAGWAPSTDPTQVFPLTDGTVSADVATATTGRFELWVGGGAYGALTLYVDGTRVGVVRHVLNRGGGYSSFGVRMLRRGMHRISIAYRGGGLRPGSDGQDVQPWPIGPLVLSQWPQVRSIVTVPAAQARSLCGRQLDWIEAVGTGGRP
jgi:hypothetical protein